MKKYILILLVSAFNLVKAQVAVDVSKFNRRPGGTVSIQRRALTVNWPTGQDEVGRLVFDLDPSNPLIKSIQLIRSGTVKEIGISLDPAFLLTVGKRDLVSQNGWNIFFDKTSKLPHQSYPVVLKKRSFAVVSEGSRTVIKIGSVRAGDFTGSIEITAYDGSPLINIAAVMATPVDSTAIIYDAGLVNKTNLWEKISWTDTKDQLQSGSILQDSSENLAVKYRMVVGVNKGGNLAVFPAPHQYFYPLDEAFNLKFTWHGPRYRKMLDGYGIGIRQDLMGDRRWVPWFNAPPGTAQRLNFFCLLNAGTVEQTVASVKRFTHDDSYKPVAGYKTMSSHFHNEYVMNVMVPGKEKPGIPNFVNVVKQSGIDIVHLGEFHYSAHPKGPALLRLQELKTLFEVCRKFSDNKLLLLPGEEPNEFFGGHWMQFFPKPVYWIMSRKPEEPMVTIDSVYGKVYRIGNAAEMLELLEKENGLSWTAHARTKGSTGFPDKYKDENFFKSPRFFGAAWKAMPADLSQPKLGKRVLDLMDDMSNWGFKKHVIAEADLFSVEPENEMYAHLNVNYLQLDALPKYADGWAPVLDAMSQGKFFVSTGEVLLPSFKVNGKGAGETIALGADGKATIVVEADWTFPLNYAEIISGDGSQVYRERINLNETNAFGKKVFRFNTTLANRKWMRLELWDVAANGAFTQQVWIDHKSF
ncbi:MAG: hypothetical protein V4725_14630 [Bacteroidota bacterium]